MIKVSFCNQTKSAIQPEPLIRLIEYGLKKYGLTDKLEIELRIVGKQTMRHLNREYRHQDYPTDVLSFPIWPNLDTIKQQTGQILLGSIVICLPTARRQAERQRQSLETPINGLIGHSLQHLLGFHHQGD